MRRLFVIVAMVVALFANNSVAQSKAVKTTAASSPKVGQEVIFLDKAMFKTLVFDYEVEKSWKYNGSLPAIIDFYADWCGPCRMLAPHLEDLQKMYKGKIQVYKVNTDKNRDLAGAFGITSLPTVVFVPMQGQPQASMGYRSLEDLEVDVKNVLKVIK